MGTKNTIGSLDHYNSTEKQKGTVEHHQSSADKLLAVITRQIKSEVNNRIIK